MTQWVIALAGLFGALGVAGGAVGAHVLRARLSIDHYESYTTAVSYLLIHAAVLLAVGIAMTMERDNWWFKLAAATLIIGIILFSGGLMMRALTGIALMAKLAPAGGVALISAWVFVAVGALTGFGKVQ